MVDTVYIEREVQAHPRTQRILLRHPKAQHIVIEKYSEVFNPSNQNFRSQKNNPSLILAAKHNNRVLETPQQYETGGGANYYFSHMLNCVYDCRYCFLQGMYRSANYLVFVNFEDFIVDMQSVAEKHKNDEKPCWFFSGYDCDSLAYEPVTQFAKVFVPAMRKMPNAVLELRTKSTQIRSLMNMPVQENVVIAYSLNPENVAQHVEKGAPSLQKRLDALVQLQNKGWRIGLRFDPIIWHEGYLDNYYAMIEQVFTALDAERIDSVTLGGFRLPKGFFKTISKLYPEHWLFAAGLEESGPLVSYRKDIEEEAFEGISQSCLRFVDEPKLFVYPTA